MHDHRDPSGPARRSRRRARTDLYAADGRVREMVSHWPRRHPRIRRRNGPRCRPLGCETSKALWLLRTRLRRPPFGGAPAKRVLARNGGRRCSGIGGRVTVIPQRTSHCPSRDGNGDVLLQAPGPADPVCNARGLDRRAHHFKKALG